MLVALEAPLPANLEGKPPALADLALVNAHDEASTTGADDRVTTGYRRNIDDWLDGRVLHDGVSVG
jgi:hypothetical protein